VNGAALAALVATHPEALAGARQQARFLCGITSPAASRARLSRDPLFGVLAERRFAEVLEWCAGAGM
jgi:ATP-dependent DNA helicase RecQ